MTLTTLIIVNAVLGAALVYALVHLLAQGVQADRGLRHTRALRLASLPREEREQIAA